MEKLKPLLKFMDSSKGLFIIVTIAVVLLALLRLVLRRSARPVIKEHIGLFTVIGGLALFSLVFLIFSYGFAAKGQVPASVVPRLWIYLLLAFCLILLVSAFRGNQDADPALGHGRLSFLFVGLMIAYMILINLVGFYISSFLFVIAGILILGYRRWPVILSVAFGWVLFSYGIFHKLLFVPLPNGALFEMLTR